MREYKRVRNEATDPVPAKGCPQRPSQMARQTRLFATYRPVQGCTGVFVPGHSWQAASVAASAPESLREMGYMLPPSN